MNYSWSRPEDRIECRAGGRVLFADTIDHWDNAVRRLLDFDEARGQAWVERVLASSPRPFPDCGPEEKIAALCQGTQAFFGIEQDAEPWSASDYAALDVFGLKADRLWVRGVGRELGVEVIGPVGIEHGILVDRATRQPARAPVYEEQYFEGKTHGLGYGNYLAQSDWRMEKSRRYVRRVAAIAQFIGRPTGAGTRLLDMGSGYGFFRAAAAEQGWQHEGEDVSAYAAKAGVEIFGFPTFVGTLEQFAAQTDATYDVVTLFDTIEHIADPEAFLHVVAGLLAPGGLCVLRTPNLRALEMEIFDRHQHSLKLEHLHYFSPASLCHLAERVGLVPEFTTTESHLLAGFLGPHLASIRQQLRGSDLFFAASKP
ncbi:MAG: class I SAM-dependent methyltransferase [Chthoniobacter sp.]|uniref:class I SAM-dependent methyltransferase n=1 Tax=Chthoniobacter sp. TaxID=2510640 RepID=UPI0032A5C28B